MASVEQTGAGPTGAAVPTIGWVGDGLELVDQTRLPAELIVLRISEVDDLVAAIRRLAVRGAPAIGVAGAYGVVLAARRHDPNTDRAAFEAAVASVRNARPTAVNLARMVDRVAAVARAAAGAAPAPGAGAQAGARATAGAGDPVVAARAEADAVWHEERDASRAMGERGADLVEALVGRTPIRAMTICNTGGLATVERGTALAVIQTLHERGHLAEAVAMETRPLLQGARLTTWELARMGAPYRLAVDGAGPFLLARGAADVVLIGADRVAANGDTANKIGSYSLALGAARAGVPFLVVAPESTVDLATPTGAAIEIEDRGPAEVVTLAGQPIAVDGTGALNPAFDVTPVDLITALVTDARVVRFDRGEHLT